MSHIIIIGKIHQMQGESVTGTGSLQRLANAVVVSQPWESLPSPTKAQQECLSYVESVADLITRAFAVEDIDSWASELEDKNTAAI